MPNTSVRAAAEGMPILSSQVALADLRSFTGEKL